MSQSPAAAPRFGRGYLTWAMGLLLLLYTSNFIDRQVLTVLQQPIKEELKLTDGQLGLLQGFAFAIFYSILGIPIARLAERRSRKTIIAVSVLVWSAMTALCGTAANFATLFLFRVGVGVGEAGSSPPAHSMIADYYPPRKRATALSVYSLGIPLGSLLGAVLGGLVAQRYGWRSAFFVVGLPGVVLAILAQFTLREPPRGHSETVEAAERDPAGDALQDVGAQAPSLGAVLRRLLSKRSFLHLAAGATLASFAGYGVNAFAAPYYIRTFGLSLAQVGLLFGVIAGVGAGVGVLAGGAISDAAG
ncbi:MAG: MFS transporter, partial [Caulobacteraceae bacterium]|nr:MFS transporter [Caulobacter sp.]